MIYGSYEYTSLSAMENGLVLIVSTLQTKSNVIIRLYPNFSGKIFNGQSGHAWLSIGTTSNYFSILFQNASAIVKGDYTNGTWTWKKILTDSIRSTLVPSGSDVTLPVGSTEHSIMIITSGWTSAVNNIGWLCSGYATGSSRKFINSIGATSSNITCTATENGYIIHNGSAVDLNANVFYLLNN